MAQICFLKNSVQLCTSSFPLSTNSGLFLLPTLLWINLVLCLISIRCISIALASGPMGFPYMHPGEHRQDSVQPQTLTKKAANSMKPSFSMEGVVKLSMVLLQLQISVKLLACLLLSSLSVFYSSSPFLLSFTMHSSRGFWQNAPICLKFPSHIMFNILIFYYRSLWTIC